jgi:hypothetical protein
VALAPGFFSVINVKFYLLTTDYNSCPTECRLINSDEPWVCKVSIRYLQGQRGRPLARVKEVSFGSPISEQSEVEERVRRAQRAALNPAQDALSFLTTSDDTARNVIDFTTNSVCLEIRGPNLTDLSFCDLPGN